MNTETIIRIDNLFDQEQMTSEHIAAHRAELPSNITFTATSTRLNWSFNFEPIKARITHELYGWGASQADMPYYRVTMLNGGNRKNIRYRYYATIEDALQSVEAYLNARKVVA